MHLRETVQFLSQTRTTECSANGQQGAPARPRKLEPTRVEILQHQENTRHRKGQQQSVRRTWRCSASKTADLSGRKVPTKAWVWRCHWQRGTCEIDGHQAELATTTLHCPRLDGRSPNSRNHYRPFHLASRQQPHTTSLPLLPAWFAYPCGVASKLTEPRMFLRGRVFPTHVVHFLELKRFLDTGAIELRSASQGTDSGKNIFLKTTSGKITFNGSCKRACVSLT